MFPKKKTEVDEAGIVKTKKSNKGNEKVDKALQKMYKKAAVKIHPDKFSNVEKTPEVEEKIEMFKSLTAAYDENNWGKFLDICDKLDILPSRYNAIIEIMKKEIDELNKKIDIQKSTFSWKLYECDEDISCRENIFKDFLFQLFQYKK